jgi:hypothetical protein
MNSINDSENVSHSFIAKMKQEKRRRHQLYSTFDFYLSSLSMFDFFSFDSFDFLYYSSIYYINYFDITTVLTSGSTDCNSSLQNGSSISIRIIE